MGDRFRNIFSSIPKNGDGYLSWEEFTSHADLEDKQEVKDAIELFKAADANGDGKVSKDEFIKLMSKSLKRFFSITYRKVSYMI